MRIVMDLQSLQTESRFRGIGRYSLSLLKAMIANNNNHEIDVVLSDLFPDSIDMVISELKSVLPERNIHVWNGVGPVYEGDSKNQLRREVSEYMRETFIASLKPDVIHITSLFEGYYDNAVTTIGKLDKSTPVCVTHYDFIPLQNEEQYFGVDENYKKHYFQKIKYLKNASVLFAISEYTKKEAYELLGSSIPPTVNIFGAVDEKFKKIKITKENITNFKKKMGLKGPFILYSGGSDPRKNLTRLIRAYGRLSYDLRKNHQLVIAGKMPDGDVLNLQKEAAVHGIGSDRLTFTGYVTDEDLIFLYNICELFVFPSWHEGFGLPALEAMSCGAVVIASNASSIPEVVGNKDALFDPFSEQSIANKMTQSLKDKGLRQRLIKSAKARCEQFTWDSCAKKVINTIENIHNIKREHLEWQALYKISEVVKNNKQKKDELIKISRSIDRNRKYAQSRKLQNHEIVFNIEGPFDSSYSLALLNRETAFELNKRGFKVGLYSTEGLGDYAPNMDYVQKSQELVELYKTGLEIRNTRCDIVTRNMFPPRVQDIEAPIKMIHHYAWEETEFPLEWVNEFNMHLDGMTCLSKHVMKIMIDNGVNVPMCVSGCGVDHWERIKVSSASNKNNKFVFLHVSSCFPRKGIECLLDAYGKAFSSQDRVLLIIKTFPNPHNRVTELLDERNRRNKNFPEVQIIFDDLTDEELKKLYSSSDVMIAPSYAEGFGLPLAESMLSGIPVITTAWGGQAEFCNKENSWLIDYEFEKTSTHLNLMQSVWAKPNTDSLAVAMREVFVTPKNVLSEKAEIGRNQLLKNFKWQDVISRQLNFLARLLEVDNTIHTRIGWVSTWETKCGIATYSSRLIENMQNKDILVFAPSNQKALENWHYKSIRCWSLGKINNGLFKINEHIEQNLINTIVIQFNYGFFNHKELSDFIIHNVKMKKAILVIFHSTNDPNEVTPEENCKLVFIKDALKQCDRLLVHSIKDLNRLKTIGLIENVALFPHGIINSNVHTLKTINTDQFIVSTYGFCLPHKGLEQIIEAIMLLNESNIPVKLKMINAEYPDQLSVNLVKRIKKIIVKQGLQNIVEFHSEFMEDDETLELLSKTDLIVFPYQETGESVSGAVRYGLSLGMPVAVTPIGIFDDISGAVFKLPGAGAREIAEGLRVIRSSLLKQNEEAIGIADRSKKWRDNYSYEKIGTRLSNMIKALLLQKSMSDLN